MRRFSEWFVLLFVVLTIAGCSCCDRPRRCDPCSPTCPPPPPLPCDPWAGCHDCYGKTPSDYLQQIMNCAMLNGFNGTWQSGAWQAIHDKASSLQTNGPGPVDPLRCGCTVMIARLRLASIYACGQAGPPDDVKCGIELNHCDPIDRPVDPTPPPPKPK